MPKIIKPKNRVAINMKAARKRNGITQYMLAKLSGVSEQAIVHIETDRRLPKLKTMEKIARVFCLEADDFQDKPELFIAHLKKLKALKPPS